LAWLRDWEECWSRSWASAAVAAEEKGTGEVSTGAGSLTAEVVEVWEGSLDWEKSGDARGDSEGDCLEDVGDSEMESVAVAVFGTSADWTGEEVRGPVITVTEEERTELASTEEATENKDTGLTASEEGSTEAGETWTSIEDAVSDFCWAEDCSIGWTEDWSIGWDEDWWVDWSEDSWVDWTEDCSTDSVDSLVDSGNSEVVGVDVEDNVEVKSLLTVSEVGTGVGVSKVVGVTESAKIDTSWDEK
jgi:hypothetical protein